MTRIAFISDQFFPKTSADSEQIICSLSALGDKEDVTLISAYYLSKKRVSKKELENYYQEDVTFDLKFISHFFKNIRGIEKISFAIRSAKKAKELDVELVYTRNIPIVISILFLTSLPIIFETFRPWPTRNILAKWFFRKLSNSSRVIGVVLHSNFAAKSFREVGFLNEKLLIAHNAVKLDAYEIANIRATREKFDLPFSKLIVTYSGRVSVEKGLMRIFDLAKALPEVLFLIVGSEEEGIIEKKAKKFSNIKILKWQDRKTMFNLLTASDILYIPNSSQAREKAQNTVLPLKTFIYKASGVPIIAPNLEDVAEVLTNMKTAVLVEPDDLKEELKGFKLLLNDKNLRNRIGTTAKIEMNDSTWEKRADKIKTFISERLKAL